MTPAHSGAVAVDVMKPPHVPQDSRLNLDVMAATKAGGRKYAILLGLAVLGVVQVAITLLLQTSWDLGLAAPQPPAFWGVYGITFVFWIGVGCAGALISALLFLCRVKWRSAVSRSAEATTIFALLTAGMFPLLYGAGLWEFDPLGPHPHQRLLGMEFETPLVWDTFALAAYLLLSAVFLYVGLLPDLAIARDRSDRVKKVLYIILALGWQGTSRQWKAYGRALLHLSGMIALLAFLLHSLMSSDFVMSVVPGWQPAILAPYFVATALFGGFAMVLAVLITVRRAFALEAYVSDLHLENMSRFLLAASLICCYSYVMECFTAWYGGAQDTQLSFGFCALGTRWMLSWIAIGASLVLPQLLWIGRLRKNVAFLFWLCVVINVGMWLERYVAVVASTCRDCLAGTWGLYAPSWAAFSVVVGSVCWFGMWFLLFLRLFPAIAMAEMKQLLLCDKRRREAP